MAYYVQPMGSASLAEFACILQTSLSTVTSRRPVLTPDLVAQLDAELGHNPFSTISSSGLDLKRLDAIGTSLWNTCSQLITVRTRFQDDIQVLAKARALAFALLNLAVPSTRPGWLRSLSSSLIVAQTCIVTQQFDIAVSILSVSAHRLQAVQSSSLGPDINLNCQFTTKYWLLRIRLAAEQQRMDIAEHLWSKVPSPFVIGNMESVMEACYIVGDSAILHAPASALQWLRRADNMLQNLLFATDTKFPGYKDWYLVIKHSIAVACLPNSTADSVSTLTVEMNRLRISDPGHPAVVLFDLTLGTTQPSIVDLIEGFKAVVLPMQITDRNMTTLFQYVHNLGLIDSNAAMEALRILLMGYMTREWTEKCFLAYLLLMSRSMDWSSTRIQYVQGVLKALEHRGYPSFSGLTAQAAVICLWKLTGLAIVKRDCRSAVDWLRICTDPKIFRSCAQDTQDLIQRKLMACHLQMRDTASARTLLDRELSQGGIDYKKLYLTYKLAMMEGQDLSEYFRYEFPRSLILNKQTSLLSCALEAQRQHKSPEFLQCLNQLMKCSTSNENDHPDFSPVEHHMFLICLVLRELGEYSSADLYFRIDEVLTNALNFAKNKSRFGNDAREILAIQLQWFYQASYRVGLKLAWYRETQFALKALKCSHEFTLLYRQVAGIEGRSKSPRPHFFLINYIRVLVYADEARRTNDNDEKRQYYHNIHACFNVMDSLLGWEDGDETPTRITTVLEEKHYGIGLFFNFEATIHLGLWDEVLKICASQDHLTFPKPQFYLQMIDLALQLNTPPAITLRIMKRTLGGIIDLIQRRSDDTVFYKMRLPRYLRCIFSLATSAVPSESDNSDGNMGVQMIDPVLGEKMLDRIHIMAENEEKKEPNEIDNNLNTVQNGVDTYIVGGRNPFPAAELMHVSLLAFNKAVEFYREAQDEECQRWAQKAINLARLVPGVSGESLVTTLQGRLATLA